MEMTFSYQFTICDSMPHVCMIFAFSTVLIAYYLDSLIPAVANCVINMTYQKCSNIIFIHYFKCKEGTTIYSSLEKRKTFIQCGWVGRLVKSVNWHQEIFLMLHWQPDITGVFFPGTQFSSQHKWQHIRFQPRQRQWLLQIITICFVIVVK